MRANKLMRIKNFSLRLGICLFLAGVPMHAAQAESFFQKLFSWGSGSSAKTQTPAASRPVPSLGSFSRSGGPGISRYHPANNEDEDGSGYDSGDANGAYRTLCVRTCDGYYFPIRSRVSSRHFSRDARQCQAMCGGEAKLFYLPKGSDDVKNMTDISGRVYSDLPNAFAYRRSLVNGCSCKPMPWSSAEAARHDHYALVESLNKAQARNAELARAEAAAKADAELLIIMAEAAAKQAAAAQAASALKLAAGPVPARSQVPVVALQWPVIANSGATLPDVFTGHLLPAAMQDAVAGDPVIMTSLNAKRPRKLASARSTRNASGKALQTASWFTSKSKYSWPGDAPARQR